MAEPLKNIYSPVFFKQFCIVLNKVIPNFNTKLFVADIYDKDWENKELKQRMKHIAQTLNNSINLPFRDSITLVLKVVAYLKNEHQTEQSFTYLFLAEFIEMFGQNDTDIALKAMEEITQFISCEYAIRPFIIKYPDKAMKKMLVWSTHKNKNVRRLSSEGCRPMLPWAMALPALKKDCSPIIPILENLKNDPSEYVRKSVANNLNDIAKNHPHKVIELVKKWQGISAQTDWILKHGCRTLLKKGNEETLVLFGLSNKIKCEIANLKIEQNEITIGDDLLFSFELKNLEKQAAKLRLEYAIYYVKMNGKNSRKIFQLSTKIYQPKETYFFSKKQSFKNLTTRKHHTGLHKIAIIVNGVECAIADFNLK
jgi:3-methyladenine DNA glycosylase AlkC